MNFFIVLGPPGAGKGTQCELLKQRLGFTHISTGEIIRNEIASGSPLGKSVKEIVESGHFVDDQTILKCFSSHLNKIITNKSETILLDGIPRNLVQAEALAKIYPNEIKGVIALRADVEKLVERFDKRRVCQNCSKIVSLNNVALDAITCPYCDAKNQLIRRKDDEPNVVRERFKIYEDQTAALLEFYTSQEILYEFDALDSVEKIYVQLAYSLLQKISGKY